MWEAPDPARSVSGGASTLNSVLPLAASDAIITGAVGLIGVLIGAALGGTVDYQLAKRAEARAAARVLQVELRNAATSLREAEEVGYWFPTTTITIDAWREHRRLLAAVLDTVSWQRVATGIQSLNEFGACTPGPQYGRGR